MGRVRGQLNGIGLRLLAAAAVLAVSTHGAAARAERQGFEFGVRSGYAIPFGKGGADATRDLNEGVAGAVPIWFDIGGRATPNVFVGGYAQYAFGILGDAFDSVCSRIDCSTHDIRLGVQMHYHFMPFESADPWLGFGIGYEWLSFDLAAGGQSASVAANGFEFVNVQSGLDLPAGDDTGVGIGPFVGFSLAEYSAVTCSGAGVTCGGIDDKAFHEWLTIGIRVTAVP